MFEADPIGFECVRPIASDALQIMQWRNDPETLLNSFHRTPKVWDHFFKEFLNDYFILPSLPPLFVLLAGQRVAFIRFRPIAHPLHEHRKCADISINVAPSFRGMGLARRALIELKDWVLAQGWDDLYAEIKPENKASLKAFEQAGYHDLGAKEKKDVESPGDSVKVQAFLLRVTPTKTKNKVFIIAEAGSNWRMGSEKRDLAMAKKLIDIAVECGADAVKFQTFKAETLYVKNAGQFDYLAKAGISEDIYTIIDDLAMPYEMLPLIAEYCRKREIEFMSSLFSVSDFEAVNPYVSRHKIASYEMNHLRLLEVVAKSGKPLYLSTGGSIESEISWSVEKFRQLGGKELTLLQCTACYPADPSIMNLNVIPWLNQRFHVPSGLSDHSRHPVYAPVAAVALGATVIEKHFTLNKQLIGPDHQFALEPDELKEMVRAIRRAEHMLGASIKIVEDEEVELRQSAHRGIQAIRDIGEGDVFQEGVNIEILRPGKQLKGVHPRYIDDIQGKKAKETIPLGTGLKFGDW